MSYKTNLHPTQFPRVVCCGLLVSASLAGHVCAATMPETADPIAKRHKPTLSHQQPPNHTPRESGKNQPSRNPSLRIETGMHAGTIWRFDVDEANRYLVTAASDKTLRLWELTTGTPVRVLRPPIGSDNEGKLSAVAMSPAGRFIASGGWTGAEWNKTISFFVFERETGRLVREVGGLPSVVTHLAFSRDGTYLAVMLGRNGVRVYRSVSTVSLERMDASLKRLQNLISP